MSKRLTLRRFSILVAAITPMLGLAPYAQALDLDWSGQFRAESHWVKNYDLDAGANLPDATRQNKGGYYITPGGASSAQFQPLFMRLTPRLIVNDNIYIKSEWWVGDPIFGLFGNAAPYGTDQRQYYSNQSRGSFITAQRFWAEVLTDVGTVQVGRVPLHWGLGVVWNSGDGLWDRYQSTGDAVRLVSKFGAFSFVPSIIKYSLGNNISGACYIGVGGCSPASGYGGVSEYSLIFKYDNSDEDFEAGVNFVKHIAGGSQDPTSGFLTVGSATDPAQPPGGTVYNVWDIFARKKFGKFTLAGELPITTGDIAGINYSTYAVALEGDLKLNDSWESSLKLGRAPGQPSTSANRPDKFRAFYFHPNYRLGMIMFNYQLANFAGPQTQNNQAATQTSLRSPFDNPIVNAHYLSWGGAYRADKWRFHTGVVYAAALESASATEANFFNTWDRKFYANAAGADQSKSLGLEWDGGTTFQWDDNFEFGLDLGWYFPGNFYKFSNVAGTENQTNNVFATALRAGIQF